MLSVGLLGVFRVAGADNRTWSELGPAGRGLASFLFAYPGRPHRRERLADLFWPELDAERARRALNSAIWRLRKLLASEPRSAGGRNLLTIGTETILERAPWLDIDATALQEATAMALRQPETLLDRATSSTVGLSPTVRVVAPTGGPSPPPPSQHPVVAVAPSAAGT